MALPMVLGAIVLIGTLIAGVMYLATQDYRVGANTLNEDPGRVIGGDGTQPPNDRLGSNEEHVDGDRRHAHEEPIPIRAVRA